ncbi:MAG: NAD(P)H-dependent oxidoreductase [Bacteroidetes bacterium]|nr:NAD(P)H-dependent oxidoreductase [Bacteroidota bacterium]
MDKLKVIGISGSLRAKSRNTALLKTAAELAKDFMDITLYDIGNVPLYNFDEEVLEIPESVKKFKSAIAGSDAILFSFPEYNASIPGVLKNAIDWASRPESPLNGIPCAIIGSSPGLSGTARAQAHFRNIASAVNMICMNKPEIQVRKINELLDENYSLNDPVTLEHLKLFLKSFESWILQFIKIKQL